MTRVRNPFPPYCCKCHRVSSTYSHTWCLYLDESQRDIADEPSDKDIQHQYTCAEAQRVLVVALGDDDGLAVGVRARLAGDAVEGLASELVQRHAHEGVLDVAERVGKGPALVRLELQRGREETSVQAAHLEQETQGHCRPLHRHAPA